MSKTAIVTGGARGIGRGCALELASRGYDIALVDLLEPEMKRTAGEIEGMGREALIYQADVASFARAHEVVADVAGKWGNIDFLLNDAGDDGLGYPDLVLSGAIMQVWTKMILWTYLTSWYPATDRRDA